LAGALALGLLTTLGVAQAQPSTATDAAIASCVNAAIDHFGTFTRHPVNVAAQTNGGMATASSTYSATYPASAVNDGDRKGATGFWNNAPWDPAPNWVQVTFSGTQTITEVDAFLVQDNYTSPADPTTTMSFSLYGLTGFEVQYWTGAAWADVPGGSIANN